MRPADTQEEVSRLMQSLQKLSEEGPEYILCKRKMQELQKKLVNLIAGCTEKDDGRVKRIYFNELSELLDNVSRFMQKMYEHAIKCAELDRKQRCDKWLAEFQSSIETYSDSMYCAKEFVEKYMIKLAATRCNLPLSLVFLHYEFKPHELLNTMISRCAQMMRVLKGVEVLRDKVEQERQQVAGNDRGMVRSSSDPALSTRSDSPGWARYTAKR